MSMTAHKIGVTKPAIVETAVLKALLGGEWPDFHGFGFDEVACWHVTPYGTLTPMDSHEADAIPIPGPDFKVQMVDDWPF